MGYLEEKFEKLEEDLRNQFREQERLNDAKMGRYREEVEKATEEVKRFKWIINELRGEIKDLLIARTDSYPEEELEKKLARLDELDKGWNDEQL